MNLDPADEHKVPAELDAAYARNVGERFDGTVHPEGHDGVPAVVDARAVTEGYGGVDLTISETNIRLNLTPEDADALGRILVREASRAGFDPSWQQRKPAAWAPARFREDRPLGTVYPAEESLYADTHDQIVTETWEGTPIGVDVEMAPALTGLWRLGYRTYVSCQGDEDTWAYIDFETPEMARQFVADFPAAGPRLEASTVRFPEHGLGTLRRELIDRKAITHWENIRGEGLRRVSRLEALFTSGSQAVAEAEMAAQGLRPVTIAHGTPETPAEEALMHQLPGLAAECGTVAGSRGGGEHVTYLFAGPDADTAAAAFTDRVRAAAPRWWRVTHTAYPSWHAGL